MYEVCNFVFSILVSLKKFSFGLKLVFFLVFLMSVLDTRNTPYGYQSNKIGFIIFIHTTIKCDIHMSGLVFQLVIPAYGTTR